MRIEKVKAHALVAETGCLNVAAELLLGWFLFLALKPESRCYTVVKSVSDDMIINTTVVTQKIGDIDGACLFDQYH